MNLDLQSTVQLFKSTVDHLPYATGLWDREIRYLYYNRAGEQMSGIPLEDAVGKTPYDVLPPELCEKFVPLIKKAIDTGETVSERLEFNFIGKEIVLAVQYVPLFNEEKEIQAVVGITEDWTELEMQRSEAMASARLASLGLLAANITHEINNPLQIVQLRLNRIEEMIKDDPTQTERVLDEVQNIYRTTERISRIVEGMRRQAKQHAHDHVGDTFVSKIVEEAITYSRNLIETSKAELKLDFSKDFKVSSKPIEIEQVLINLISNSCDAISQLDERWIKISTFEKIDEVVIQVSDSGNGIPKDIQKNLMKPFFTTKEFSKGTGLGLNLSKTMMRRNKGSLHYMDDEPHTTFQIRLPKS